MMKSQEMFHPKLRRLMNALKIPRWQAVGLLEAIWTFTETWQPDGGLGRSPDEDIADYIGYLPEDFPRVIKALLDTGWLDLFERDNEVRFVVHDWADHMVDSIKKADKAGTRKGKDFKVLRVPPENCGNSQKIAENSGEVATSSTRQPLNAAADFRPTNTRTNTNSPPTPQREFSAARWDKLAKRFGVGYEFKQAHKLTLEVLAHLLAISREMQEYDTGIKEPLAVARSRAKKGQTPPTADLRLIKAWLYPPPAKDKCHCGGKLENYYAAGSGLSGDKCLSCGEDYPRP